MSRFNTIHLASPSPRETALGRVREHGGSVVTGLVRIAAGRFACCLDPDGNAFSLFVR